MTRGFAHFFHLLLAIQVEAVDLLQLRVELHDKLYFDLVELRRYLMHWNRQRLRL